MQVRAAAAPRTADATAVAVAAGAVDDPFLVARGFTAKPGEVVAAPATDGRGVVLHVGVGPAAEVTPAVLRRAAGAATRAAGAAKTLVLDLGADAASSKAIAEGAVLGAYRYTTYRTKPNGSSVEEVVVARGNKAAVAVGA